MSATPPPKGHWIFPITLFFLSVLLVTAVVGGAAFAFHLLPSPRNRDLSKLEGLNGNDWADAEMKISQAQITETMAIVRLAQFTIGMLIGVFLLCIGTYLSWVGVREKIGLDLRAGEKVKATLSSLGPGMVLAVCGTIIIVTCLMKDFRYSERDGIRLASAANDMFRRGLSEVHVVTCSPMTEIEL
jgi:hypothetical protein